MADPQNIAWWTFSTIGDTMIQDSSPNLEAIKSGGLPGEVAWMR
jgi:hypothetical protein